MITGPDFTGLSTPPSNPHWGEHGTWMASIIAGHGHDGGGERHRSGVAPEAKILSIRVIPDKDDPGYTKYDDEPEQTDPGRARRRDQDRRQGHAQVISMSIGYSAPSGAVRAALQYAYDHGIVLVASSGNSGDNDDAHGNGTTAWPRCRSPPSTRACIGVGAVTMRRHAGQSSRAATSRSGSPRPGKAVPAQGRNGLYYTVDGTSPACALVAGVAALIESRYPVITPAQVTEALTTTASNRVGSYNVRTGFGTWTRARRCSRRESCSPVHQAASPVAAVGALRRRRRRGAGRAGVAARRRGLVLFSSWRSWRWP